MSPILDYLNLMVDVLNKINKTFLEKDFQTKIPIQITAVHQLIKKTEQEIWNPPEEIKDALLDLKTLLEQYKNELPKFKNDLVKARIYFKELCLKTFKDALVQAKYTKFENFSILAKISI